MSTEPPRRLTIAEFCERTGLDPRKAAQGFREGKLPGIRIGRYYLIYETWVEQWERGEPGFWSIAIAGITIAPAPTPIPTQVAPAPVVYRLVPEVA